MVEKKRLFITSLIILIVIPIVGFGCYKLFGKGMYMPLSLIILIATMVPFFMVFERRKPRAREVMLIAMMCAITVTVHTAFHIFMPIQIGTALVIISGISLGPEAGFLIGALSRLICNFYAGQGPWTPWQMFSWGLLGFLAGLIFNRDLKEELKSRSFKVIMGPLVTMIFSIMVGYVAYIIWPSGDNTFWGWRIYVFGFIGLIAGVLVQRKRLPIDGLTMTITTFLMVFIIYGSIMNISSLINSANMAGATEISVMGLKLVFLSGVPHDFAHSLTASICVFLFGESFIGKLERIKIKYGIYK